MEARGDEELAFLSTLPQDSGARARESQGRPSRAAAVAAAAAVALLASALVLCAAWQGNALRARAASLGRDGRPLQAYGSQSYDPQWTAAAAYPPASASSVYAQSGAPASTNVAQGVGAAGEQQGYSSEYAAAAAAGYGGTPSSAASSAVVDGSQPLPYGSVPPAPSGPLEFSGGGGPEMVAGTKVVQAGAEDLGVDGEYTHDPQPYPPPSYKKDNPPMTVMLYRAQSDQDYPMRNVNVADLPGVMWYLHNEIVGFPDKDWRIRHFNITRILRFKANIWNPQVFFQQQHTKWGPYVAYNAGKCTGDNCDRYQDWGAVVGCQLADQNVANYASFTGHVPVWVSLPGPCPTHEYGAKQPLCMSMSPGGDCGSNHPVTGARDCSYTLEDYGFVRLDDFLPSWYGQQTDFKSFFDNGGREYDKDTDKGVYDTFWDGIFDPDANLQRMKVVQERFAAKYPEYTDADSFPDIKCDTA